MNKISFQKWLKTLLKIYPIRQMSAYGRKNQPKGQTKREKVTTSAETTSGTSHGWPGISKYSYPNYKIGNPSLGISENPKALRWPFRSTDKQ